MEYLCFSLFYHDLGRTVCSQVNVEECDILIIFLQVHVIVSSCFEGGNVADWDGAAD